MPIWFQSAGTRYMLLKGVGALYIRHGVWVKPIPCGSEQEQGLRPGTESVPLIASFGRGNGKAVPEHRRTSGTGFSASQQSDRTAAGNGRRDRSGHRGASPYVLNISCWAIARRSCCTIWSSGKFMFPAARHVPREPAAAYWNYSGQSPQRWTVPANQLLCREHRGGYCSTGTGLRDAQKELMH